MASRDTQRGNCVGGWPIVICFVLIGPFLFCCAEPSSTSSPSRAHVAAGHAGGTVQLLMRREGPPHDHQRMQSRCHSGGVVATTITIVTTNITATTECGEEGLCRTTTTTTSTSTTATTTSSSSRSVKYSEDEGGGGGAHLAMHVPTRTLGGGARPVRGCGPGPLDCLIGKTCCLLLCVDLNTDNLNCGECGLACADDESCELGLCGYAS